MAFAFGSGKSEDGTSTETTSAQETSQVKSEDILKQTKPESVVLDRHGLFMALNKYGLSLDVFKSAKGGSIRSAHQLTPGWQTDTTIVNSRNEVFPVFRLISDEQRVYRVSLDSIPIQVGNEACVSYKAISSVIRQASLNVKSSKSSESKSSDQNGGSPSPGPSSNPACIPPVCLKTVSLRDYLSNFELLLSTPPFSIDESADMDGSQPGSEEEGSSSTLDSSIDDDDDSFEENEEVGQQVIDVTIDELRDGGSGSMANNVQTSDDEDVSFRLLTEDDGEFALVDAQCTVLDKKYESQSINPIVWFAFSSDILARAIAAKKRERMMAKIQSERESVLKRNSNENSDSEIIDSSDEDDELYDEESGSSEGSSDEEDGDEDRTRGILFIVATAYGTCAQILFDSNDVSVPFNYHGFKADNLGRSMFMMIRVPLSRVIVRSEAEELLKEDAKDSDTGGSSWWFNPASLLFGSSETTEEVSGPILTRQPRHVFDDFESEPISHSRLSSSEISTSDRSAMSANPGSGSDISCSPIRSAVSSKPVKVYPSLIFRKGKRLCDCGVPMKKVKAKNCYDSSGANCDSCGIIMKGSDVVWHCENCSPDDEDETGSMKSDRSKGIGALGKPIAHENGFDLCDECSERLQYWFDECGEVVAAERERHLPIRVSIHYLKYSEHGFVSEEMVRVVSEHLNPVKKRVPPATAPGRAWAVMVEHMPLINDRINLDKAVTPQISQQNAQSSQSGTQSQIRKKVASEPGLSTPSTSRSVGSAKVTASVTDEIPSSEKAVKKQQQRKQEEATLSNVSAEVVKSQTVSSSNPASLEENKEEKRPMVTVTSERRSEPNDRPANKPDAPVVIQSDRTLISTSVASTSLSDADTVNEYTRTGVILKRALRFLQMEDYARVFIENEIYDYDLLFLSEDAVSDLIDKVGPRVRFIAWLNQYQQKHQQLSESVSRGITDFVGDPFTK